MARSADLRFIGEPRPRGKARARRRAIGGLVVTVLLLGVLLFAVFPTRSLWQQRREIAIAEAKLAETRSGREQVPQAQKKLENPAEIERRAKEDLNMVNPGEEAYNILPAPTDPIGLPEGWPFIGVERVFGAS
jgi:cell division protein FtsB